MLEEVRLQGLGVIDDAVLPLAPGLTVLTGETGAGKTMVVSGLGLLLGGRADPGRVRGGAARALVEGRLVLPPDHPAVVRALDAGGELDDGVLLLSRTVSVDGRSRAHLGGRSVPVGVLAELADSVVAVHGQSDQQRMLRPAEQRAALDRFGGPPVLELRDRYRAAWARWRDVRSLLAELRGAAADRAREAELLRLGLAEVEALAPLEGEDRALVAEAERLGSADELRAAAAAASQALTGEDGVDAPDALGLVTAARRAVESASAHDAALEALARRLAEVAHLLVDVAGDVASYGASVEADPARLAAVHDRRAALTGLVRRLAVDDVDAVLGWAREASDRLLALDQDDDRVAALAEEDARLEAELGALAADLSAARQEAAARFGAAVAEELAELAMPDARVEAAVSQRDDPDGLPVGNRRVAVGPDGVDDVELLLAAHRGAPLRPLHKGASGGELSRTVLAVEVVFAGANPVPVMVFDEVDAGVGGKAAVEVGRRLARLARDHQVLVVTHLPQVAAFADHHLHVVKDGADAVVRSGVVVLEGEERVVELSRMLAGLDSGLARAHAEELLRLAADERAVSR